MFRNVYIRVTKCPVLSFPEKNAIWKEFFGQKLGGN